MNTENKSKDEVIFGNDDISYKEILIKLKHLSTILKSKYKLLLIACVLGGLVGYINSFFETPVYKSVLTFAMEEEKSTSGGLSGALGLASSFGIDLGSGGGGAFASSNLTELMKSRLIFEKVILSPVLINNKIISLAEYYIQIKNLRKKWRNDTVLSKIIFSNDSNRKNFSRQQDSILQIFYKNLIDKNYLNISQKDKKVTILSIEVKSEDELFAKLFCEKLAKETSDFYIETKSKKARNNVNVLQKQVDSIKNELKNSIEGVASAADDVYNLNPAFNIKGSKSKRRQVDVQSNTAILTNLVVQLELAKITLRKETPLIQLIDEPILPLEKTKLGTVASIFIGSVLLIFITMILVVINSLTKINKNY